MTWSRRFSAREYRRSSLLIWPLAGGVIGAILGPLDVLIDKNVDLPSIWQYSPEIAGTLIASIVGAAAALTGFVVTVTVLVVQMATSTFSARYMRLIYRDPVLKGVLALLVGTLTFSLSILRRVTPTFVPNLGMTVDGLLVVLSLVFFLLFLDRFMHRLRPVAVASIVAERVRATLLSHQDALSVGDGPLELPRDVPARVVTSIRAGAIQAVNPDLLLRWATEHDAVVVLRHGIGDFVPSGAPLMDVYGDVGGADVNTLRGFVATGHERTIDQDAAFALRIMVDIAIRALSPAVNDPTTAVQVLNYLSEALRLLGTRTHGAWVEGRNAVGRSLLFIRTPTWSDYLALAVTEIREYGGESLQVLRRLRALLEELAEDVLPEHVAAIEDELARLDETLVERFGDSVDRDRAARADRQGLGGPAEWERLLGT